jgi:crossover junction endodeoxyribonuclease RuvC
VVSREGGRLVVLESGVLVPGDRHTMPERLAAILGGLSDVIRRTRPEVASVEEVYAGASARSALVLGQARGVALAAAAQAGLLVHEYAPASVKLAFTGNGRASKEQMLRTARLLLGAQARFSDEADALALAVCHLARRTGRHLAPARSPRQGNRRSDGDRVQAALRRMCPARRDHRGPA